MGAIQVKEDNDLYIMTKIIKDIDLNLLISIGIIIGEVLN